MYGANCNWIGYNFFIVGRLSTGFHSVRDVGGLVVRGQIVSVRDAVVPV